MKDFDNVYGVSYMNKYRLKWEYIDSLRIANRQPFCFEIMKNNRYTLHC